MSDSKIGLINWLLLKSTTWLILISLLTISCHQNQKSQNKIAQDTYQNNGKITLTKDGSVTIPLDSLTPKLSFRVQSYDVKGKQYFTSLNEYTGNLYYYNLNNPSEFDLISFSGTDSLGFSKATAYTIMQDNIYVLHGKNVFAVYNLKGGLVQYKKLNTIQGVFALEGFLGATVNPILIDEGYAFLNRSFGAFGNFGKPANSLAIKINLKNLESELSFNFPKSYKEGSWGINMTMCYSTINTSDNIIVYSFPNSHKLYVTNYFGRQESYEAKSNVQAEIKSSQKKDMLSLESRNRYFNSTLSYGAVAWDEFRNVYYRFVELPIPESILDLNDPIKSRTKRFSIVVLDSDFVKLGETALPKYTYSKWVFFINKDGLYLENWKETEDSEQFIKFDRFILKEN